MIADRLRDARWQLAMAVVIMVAVENLVVRPVSTGGGSVPGGLKLKQPLRLWACRNKSNMTADELEGLHAVNRHCLGFNGTAVPCFDPLNCSRCTPGASKRSALVLVDDLVRPWSSVKVAGAEAWVQKWAGWAQKSQADLIVMVPSETAPRYVRAPKSASTPTGMRAMFLRNALKPQVVAVIKRYAILWEVPWVIPPNISLQIPHKTGGYHGCCGLREYMRMQVFGLTQYDAAIYVDTDIEVLGDMRPLFDCAASGFFLCARDKFAAVNSGFFAVKPQKRLMDDMLEVLSTSTASKRGWNGWPLGPQSKVGQVEMQGFLFHYMLQRGPLPSTVVPVQIEPCKWTGAGMCKNYWCPELVLNHKQDCSPEALRAEKLAAMKGKKGTKKAGKKKGRRPIVPERQP